MAEFGVVMHRLPKFSLSPLKPRFRYRTFAQGAMVLGQPDFERERFGSANVKRSCRKTIRRVYVRSIGLGN